MAVVARVCYGGAMLPLAELRRSGVIEWSADPARMAPHLVDWRGRIHGRAAMMLWPRHVADVVAIVRAAAAERVPLTVQGGNTGLVGGATPDATGHGVVMVMTRMTAIGVVDTVGLTLIAEAGAVLSDVHAAAAAAGLAFPLDLAAKGSATIGGLVSTNAGGVQVLRHGTMRARVTGLEAVLPDGTVLDQLSPLVKDTGGYDIKQLLIGAEGTLGIVTRACLRLVPAAGTRVVAWAGVADPAAALALLARLRRRLGEVVDSFELIPLAGVELVAAHGLQPPLATPAPWQVLIDLASVRDDPGLAATLVDELAAADVVDAVVAQSERQAAALWRIRETMPEAERRDGIAVKHDLAVPVPALPDFVAATTPIVESGWLGSRVLAFGHVGDGNLHYNVRAPIGVDSAGWVAEHGTAITRAVNDRVVAIGGTIAAEHGIGQVKAAELVRVGDPGRLAAMRAVKAALDPHRIMNPGKVIG